jgi:hypothetical protein
VSIFQVDGDEGADEMPETELKNAAWYYPEPKEKAKKIKDYVAFCEFSSFLFFLFGNFSLVCVFREGVEEYSSYLKLFSWTERDTWDLEQIVLIVADGLDI